MGILRDYSKGRSIFCIAQLTGMTVRNGFVNDIDKVEPHLDKAPSHISKSAAAYLAKEESKIEIKCVPFDEVLVKLPEAALMDFCVFGLLKRALGKRHSRTLN
ncbi:hypothetical protein TNCV_607171 [Trichonephila clavipes]|nr:hypothetical protein TNCV_607171 [Trichonephila clavipes]